MATPQRGDIWSLNLNPTAGKEQQGHRPVLVVSTGDFNALGITIICPVTQGGSGPRFAGFAATLSGAGTKTQGVVMCNQPRAVDMNARQAQWIESVPSYVMEDVLSRLQPIFE